MGELVQRLIVETAHVFYESSVYILLGFAIAGLLHELLPTDLVARQLGREHPRAIAAAALLGAPMPLCSCGVIPTAAALREKGAARSPTMTFLIATPETGVDSIALTYGLLGGVMAIVRPLVAVVTAMVAGWLSMLLAQRDVSSPASAGDGVATSAPMEEPPQESRRSGDGCHCDDAGRKPTATGPAHWPARLRQAAHYGFVTLLDDLALWLVLGLLLTGVLSTALPDDFLSRVLGLDRGIVPLLLVIAASVPLYLCATASTPVAAALVAKGLSPGAALVFLLVGPATNAATIAVVARLLGRQRLLIYLGSIIGVALAAGLLLDGLAADAVRRATLAALSERESGLLGLLKAASALAFVVLLGLSARRTRFREALREVRTQAAALRDVLGDLGRRS
jgi:uncharacterized membrane protein YraQ (UPF0718 family)